MCVKFFNENLNPSLFSSHPTSTYIRGMIKSIFQWYIKGRKKKSGKMPNEVGYGWTWFVLTVKCKWLMHWTQIWPILDTIKFVAEKF